MTLPSYLLTAEITQAVIDLRAKHARLQAEDPTYWQRNAEAEKQSGRTVSETPKQDEMVIAPEQSDPSITTYVRAVPKIVRALMSASDTPMSNRRLAICQTCEHWKKGRCEKCGCFTRLKVRLPSEACPIGKWAAEG